ncbi:MAG: transcriptional repressor, partial [Candidatus Adiutricales bacterium]
HPTADEVFRTVRERLPRISLGTIYRNLELMSEQGLIKVTGQGGIQRRYEGNMKEHYHLKCVSCGRLEDAPVETISFPDDPLREKSDFKILGHNLEFLGLCPECRMNNDPE